MEHLSRIAWRSGVIPRTSTQLRYLAVTENRSVQALLAEAIDLLFQARGLATRDEWPFYVPAARRR